MNYPFTSKIDELLDLIGQTKEWLSTQMGISSRTLYNKKNFAELSLVEISKISAALNFDFVRDYNAWLQDNEDDALLFLFEPKTAYKSAKKMSVNLKLTGSPNSFKDFDKLLTLINKEGEKHGFQVSE